MVFWSWSGRGHRGRRFDRSCLRPRSGYGCLTLRLDRVCWVPWSGRRCRRPRFDRGLRGPRSYWDRGPSQVVWVVDPDGSSRVTTRVRLSGSEGSGADTWVRSQTEGV